MPDDAPADGAPYQDILTSIVKRFVRLVGPQAALRIARRIPHLSVDDDGNVLDYDRDDPLGNLRLLIDQFELVFGDAAISLSRQASRPVVEAREDLPVSEADIISSGRASPTRVLLVDDHVLFREGLVSLLDPQPDMKVVGQAGSVREAIGLARQLQPDLVLMDISLPDGTGVEATRAILAERPVTRIVFLTVHEDDEQLFAAIRAGARGYLFKNVRAADLLKQVRGVVRGDAGVSPALARRILEEFSRLPATQQADTFQKTDLTAREIEIVREIARGASNRQIARQLIISENTVKNHVRNVLSKLHLRSRRDVATYARDRGLTPPPSQSTDNSPRS